MAWRLTYGSGFRFRVGGAEADKLSESVLQGLRFRVWGLSTETLNPKPLQV